MNSKKGLSIIVPTLNESENISQLVFNIDSVLRSKKIPYEILFIDGGSTDATEEEVNLLLQQFPVRFIAYSAETGKAAALLYGVSFAMYPFIAFLDADLQYDPGYLPEFYDLVRTKQYDIVVGNRDKKDVEAGRKLVGAFYQNIFGSMLHSFDVDVRSSLKVFQREILDRIQMQGGLWTFDLEFLVKARNAGYSIGGIPIQFQKREKGITKFHALSATWELLLSAITLRIASPAVVPFTAAMKKKEGQGFHYKGKKFIHHSSLHHSETALNRVTRMQILVMLLIIGIFALGLILNWHEAIVLFIACLTILYFFDLLFNFFLIYRSFAKTPELTVSDDELAFLKNSQLPIYTIFCPLYKEWAVVPQFVSAMEKMEYPKEKLQVMLLLEEDDKETIAKIAEYDLPSNFEVVITPDSNPKTKPKACNYGLLTAKGEYVVIYDAEDVPETNQLRKAYLAFQKANRNVVCIQAKLNFYNSHQNILTRAFTAEYSLWFDLVLTGLQSVEAPIPLGGTSNHFRVSDLKLLQGWDAFNVTEDCDLGIRLTKKGYKTALLDSTTYEEANSDLKNWFNQRTRWIKGYIQTYLVHMRHPKTFLRDWREPDIFTFQLIVGGKVLSMFINPLMWTLTAVYFLERAKVGIFIESFFPTPILYMGVFSLIFGNFLYMYYYMIGCAKRGYDDLIKYVFLIPFYWLSMSVAAWKAMYQIMVKPHYWSKTVHGLHLNNKKAMDQAESVVGRNLVEGLHKHTPDLLHASSTELQS